MLKNGKILVATDFSQHSDDALRQACTLAEAFDGVVHLLHVRSPVPYFEIDMISVVQLPEVDEAMQKGAKKRITEQACLTSMPVLTHIIDDASDPALAICQFAEQLAADLIVTGRHGHQSAVEHIVIGSTSERIVRHATCPVLVSVPSDSVSRKLEAEEE